MWGRAFTVFLWETGWRQEVPRPRAGEFGSQFMCLGVQALARVLGQKDAQRI